MPASNPAADTRREILFSKVLGDDVIGWPQMSWSDKEEAMRRAILLLQQRLNIGIMNSPAFYVKEMDDLIQGYDPLHGKASLVIALRYLAVKNYDFRDGQDPDKTAAEVLGPEAYQLVKEEQAFRKEEERQNLLAGSW